MKWWYKIRRLTEIAQCISKKFNMRVIPNGLDAGLTQFQSSSDINTFSTWILNRIDLSRKNQNDVDQHHCRSNVDSNREKVEKQLEEICAFLEAGGSMGASRYHRFATTSIHSSSKKFVSNWIQSNEAQATNQEGNGYSQPITRRPMRVHRRRVALRNDADSNTRYKTELCRHYDMFNCCPLNDNCHFAHGPDELKRAREHPRYRTEVCKNVKNCPFGQTCHFIHPPKGGS